MELNLDENKKELFIKTAFWNSLIEFFKKKKNQDIENYLVSISIKWKTIFITTNNPTFNSEILLFEENIKKLISEKLLKIWVDFWKYELRYKV